MKCHKTRNGLQVQHQKPWHKPMPPPVGSTSTRSMHQLIITTKNLTMVHGLPPWWWSISSDSTSMMMTMGYWSPTITESSNTPVQCQGKLHYILAAVTAWTKGNHKSREATKGTLWLQHPNTPPRCCFCHISNIDRLSCFSYHLHRERTKNSFFYSFPPD